MTFIKLALNFFILLLINISLSVSLIFADTSSSLSTAAAAATTYYFFSRPQSIKISEPKVFELDFNKDRKMKQKHADSSVSSSAQKVPNNHRNIWCSVLLHIQGDIEPGRKYESRVSFAGTPPMKYELETIHIPQSDSKKKRITTLQTTKTTSKRPNNNNNDDKVNADDDDDDDNTRKNKFVEEVENSPNEENAKKNRNEVTTSKENRILLDTERTQFRTKNLDTFEFTKLKAHRAALHAREKARSENVGDFFEKDFAVKKISKDLFSVIHRTPRDNDNFNEQLYELEETFLCVRVSELGVPSEAFAKMTTESDGMYKIKFVVTIDKMLFGALPTSALPSVLIAVFFVVVGVTVFLPRMLKMV